MKQFLTIILVIILAFTALSTSGQTAKPMKVIAYYTGDGNDLGNYKINKLTHIIFSFLHLKGNMLTVDNATDSLAITKLVDLKKTNPQLKVILSLGGWGGCPTCSEVFDNEIGRREFAQSVLKTLILFKADGLDLDWEYPALPSEPGCQFKPDDKMNFSSLIKTLRATLGQSYELSFAAGGFKDYLDQSIDWKMVMPFVDHVNLMTYDFVHGYSSRTGHLSALYSTEKQSESVDYAIKYFDSIGVPSEKLIIGLAFYARTFTGVADKENGLYQKGKFSQFIFFKDWDKMLNSNAGYEYFWDKSAKAPYAYNKSAMTFATFDNMLSINQKTKYAKDHKLGGVMFWELKGDKPSVGLLDMIYEVINQ